MNTETHSHSGRAAAQSAGALTSRPIASGDRWSITEVVCTLGPHDRSFEERHEQFAISAVVAGSFRYRSGAGHVLLHPGALLLGNAQTCYECGHDHAGGDRCIAIHYDPALFEEIAASAAGSHRFRFSTAMLPARRALTRLVVELETAAREHLDAADELAVRFAERVLGATSGTIETTVRATAREQRRIGGVVRYIERHSDERLDLAALARIACMSKYHFLRTFRKVVGVTPHQFLLDIKLRRAALGLRTTSVPVATVALEAGFGDLSTFNSHFRSAFGAKPSAFRLGARRVRAD